MTDLAFKLERTVTIRAERTTVFRYFTDPERFARWWGKGSLIEPHEGGRVSICYPNGATASGTVLEIRAPERIVFSYGYDDPTKPLAPGASRVVIELHESEEGTRLELRHEVATEALREMHVAGWRYQLAVFAHVVTQEQHADAAAKIDRWFQLWSGQDPEQRRERFTEIAIDAVSFRDAWGCVQGIGELSDHVAALAMHMPARLERRGPVRQGSGTALADWVAIAEGERELMKGTNVFELAPDGRIARVVGISS